MTPGNRRLLARASIALWPATAACGPAEQRNAPPPNVNSSIAIGSDTLDAHEIRAYLAGSLGFTSRDGRVFCSYAVLGQEEDRVYLDTVCEEFLLVDDSLESGSGSGGPVALVLDTLSEPMRIAHHRIPGDGNRYSRDIRRIFPEPIQRQILGETDEHNRRMVSLLAANRDAARAYFRESEFPFPPAETQFESHPSEDLVRAAEDIIGFLRGEVSFERIRLADTIALHLGPEGGGTRREIPRDRLRNPANWRIRSDELGMTYAFTPPAGLTNLSTGVGIHYRCLDYPLSAHFRELAQLPHVGTKLTPPDASSCLQSWNVTLVFAAHESLPSLVAAVYDQWEW